MSDAETKVQIAVMASELKSFEKTVARVEEKQEKMEGQVGWAIKLIIGAIIVAVLRETGIIQ